MEQVAALEGSAAEGVTEQHELLQQTEAQVILICVDSD